MGLQDVQSQKKNCFEEKFLQSNCNEEQRRLKMHLAYNLKEKKKKKNIPSSTTLLHSSYQVLLLRHRH